MGDWEKLINTGLRVSETTLAICEVKSALAGHLAFGHQKKRMMQYYRTYAEKFAMSGINSGKDTP